MSPREYAADVRRDVQRQINEVANAASAINSDAPVVTYQAPKRARREPATDQQLIEVWAAVKEGFSVRDTMELLDVPYSTVRRVGRCVKANSREELPDYCVKTWDRLERMKNDRSPEPTQLEFTLQKLDEHIASVINPILKALIDDQLVPQIENAMNSIRGTVPDIVRAEMLKFRDSPSTPSADDLEPQIVISIPIKQVAKLLLATVVT